MRELQNKTLLSYFVISLWKNKRYPHKSKTMDANLSSSPTIKFLLQLFTSRIASQIVSGLSFIFPVGKTIFSAGHKSRMIFGNNSHYHLYEASFRNLTEKNDVPNFVGERFFPI